MADNTELDAKVAKLPQWAQFLIRQQAENIARLEGAIDGDIADPWLWSLSNDHKWRPIAGSKDFMVRYTSANPSTPDGQEGLQMQRLRDELVMTLSATEGVIQIQPVSMNMVRIHHVSHGDLPESNLS